MEKGDYPMSKVSDEPLMERDNLINFPSETIGITKVDDFRFDVEVGIVNDLSTNKYIYTTVTRVTAVTPHDAELIAHNIVMGLFTAALAVIIREAE